MGKATAGRREVTTKNRVATVRRKQPEQVIGRLALEGKLAVVGEKAKNDSFKLGLPVTRLQGNEIVKIFPDGSKEVIKTLSDYSAGKAV